MTAITAKTTRSGKFCLLALFTLLSLAEAQVIRFGRCPSSVTTVQVLILDEYVGRWYEYSRYPFIFEAMSKCVHATYNELPDGTISVRNYGVNRLTSRTQNVNGTATVSGPGKLTVKLNNGPVVAPGSNYWILDTDYRSFAVVYSCSEFLGILHGQVVWILTRDRLPSQTVIEAAEAVVAAKGLPLRPLQKTDQQNCPLNN